MRILVVDDSETIRTKIIEKLEEINGVSIVGQLDSLSHLCKILRTTEPDLVILDIQIQNENGINAIADIKKDEKAPIVVMFTNYPYLQLRKKCFDLGADYFFYKSGEFDKLIHLVGDLVLE